MIFSKKKKTSMQLTLDCSTTIYLLVTDFEGDKDIIFKKISEKVKPHLKNIYLDQLEFNTEFGKEVTKDIKPFYRKKTFGIF